MSQSRVKNSKDSQNIQKILRKRDQRRIQYHSGLAETKLAESKINNVVKQHRSWGKIFWGITSAFFAFNTFNTIVRLYSLASMVDCIREGDRNLIPEGHNSCRSGNSPFSILELFTLFFIPASLNLVSALFCFYLAYRTSSYVLTLTTIQANEIDRMRTIAASAGLELKDNETLNQANLTVRLTSHILEKRNKEMIHDRPASLLFFKNARAKSAAFPIEIQAKISQFLGCEDLPESARLGLYQQTKIKIL